MTRLVGRAVVVTGAGRGIGAAYARAAAAAGASVVVNDVDADVAGQTVEAIRAGGGRAIAHPGDIADWDGAQRLVQRCVDEYGALDGFVNNAGVFDLCQPPDTTERMLRSIVEVNLLGTAFCGVHAMRRMLAQGRGSIVNVTSGAMAGLSLLGAYGASKAGVAALTRSWAADLAGTGVRVNAISPMAHTRMNDITRRFLGAAGESANIDHLPPEVNAPVVVFLLSDDAAGVHGQIVRVQGGDLSLVTPPAVAEPVLHRDGWTAEAVAEAFATELRTRLVPLPAAGQVMARSDSAGDGQAAGR